MQTIYVMEAGPAAVSGSQSTLCPLPVYLGIAAGTGATEPAHVIYVPS